jgi:hypothetical protein
LSPALKKVKTNHCFKIPRIRCKLLTAIVLLVAPLSIMALFLPSTPIIVTWMTADRTSRSYGSLQSPTNTGPAPDGPLPRFPYMGWLICCAVVSPSLVGLVLVFFLILGSIYPGTLAFYRRKTLFHFENRGQYVLADSTDNICISSYSSLLLLIIPCYVSSEPS